MIKRFLGLSFVSLLVGLVLAACSSAPTNLDGEAAYTSLVKTVEDSVAHIKDTGGFETIVSGENYFLVAYDPSAPTGKQVALLEAESANPATFATEEVIRTVTLLDIVKSDSIKNAKTAYADGKYTVKGDQFDLSVNTKENYVSEVLLNVTDGKNTQSQLFATTYSLDDYAKKVLAGATPAPEPAK